MTEASDYLGEKPQTRDLTEHFDCLTKWVTRRMAEDGAARLVALEPTPASANGYAGESFVMTVAFESGSKRFLLKRKPTRHLYFPEHDFAAEFRVQAALAADGRVPVAPAAAFEADPTILGAPFYVLGFVVGRPTPDRPSYHHEGWLSEMGAQEQHAICVSGLEALARLHSLSLDDVGAEFLRRAHPTQTQLAWDLAYWDRFAALAWPDGPPATVAAARAWLGTNAPATSELGISWGDARPGNILFDGTRCAAIIDWDMAGAGPPEKDLGYWIAMDLQFERVADQLGGRSRLTGWPARSEMLEIYERAANRRVDPSALRYYRVFAAYLIASMYARYVNMRADLDRAAKAEFLSEMAAPIALAREELEAAR